MASHFYVRVQLVETTGSHYGYGREIVLDKETIPADDSQDAKSIFDEAVREYRGRYGPSTKAIMDMLGGKV